jgi:hypothetical protein
MIRRARAFLRWQQTCDEQAERWEQRRRQQQRRNQTRFSTRADVADDLADSRSDGARPTVSEGTLGMVSSALGRGAKTLAPVVQGAIASAPAIVGSLRQPRALAGTGRGVGGGRF